MGGPGWAAKRLSIAKQIHELLGKLAGFVRREEPGASVRGVVDTAPLLERDFARLAGLGWIGKNTMVLNRDFKRLGDIVAGTVVVYKDRPVVPAKLAPAVPVPVSIPLGLAEQRAIIDYAERAPGLSRDRAFELAEVIEPLAGSPAPIAAKRLLGMAHWLSGKR
jgi:hypothetical protein